MEHATKATTDRPALAISALEEVEIRITHNPADPSKVNVVPPVAAVNGNGGTVKWHFPQATRFTIRFDLRAGVSSPFEDDDVEFPSEDRYATAKLKQEAGTGVYKYWIAAELDGRIRLYDPDIIVWR